MLCFFCLRGGTHTVQSAAIPCSRATVMLDELRGTKELRRRIPSTLAAVECRTGAETRFPEHGYFSSRSLREACAT